jgi:hypothetical protein
MLLPVNKDLGCWTNFSAILGQSAISFLLGFPPGWSTCIASVVC